MDIANAINNLGFPIAMVVYFIWDKNKSTQTMIKAIENNSKLLSLVLRKLNIEENEVDNYE